MLGLVYRMLAGNVPCLPAVPIQKPIFSLGETTRGRNKGTTMKIYGDFSDDFWPSESWVLWVCIALGVFDVSLIGFLVRSIVIRGL